MFVVAVEFETYEWCTAEFKQALLKQAQASLLKEADCHRFDVSTNPDVPEEFFLYEVYTTASAFEDHLKTSYFREFDSKTESWVKLKKIKTYELLHLSFD